MVCGDQSDILITDTPCVCFLLVCGTGKVVSFVELKQI